METRRVRYATERAGTSPGAGGSVARAHALLRRLNVSYAKRTNGQTDRTGESLTVRAANLATKALFWFIVGAVVYGLIVGLTH